ncbi:MAG: hypothetical protein KDC75_23275 [Phaeodactylibacter sp.]|nr:hypothetical protein [Phaeodactylibacter sp.]
MGWLVAFLVVVNQRYNSSPTFHSAPIHATKPIQAKFSATESNFEKKSIHSDDILKMEITKITKGEQTDSNGTEYNDKIKRFQRKLSEIRDIAKYDYVVIFLGNRVVPK